MYAFKTTQVGSVACVLDKDGLPVPANDPDFDKWIATFDPPINVTASVFPKDGTVFLDVEGLVAHCKRNGLMLIANEGGFQIENSFHITGLPFFRNFQRAVEVRAIDPGSGIAPGKSEIWATDQVWRLLCDALADDLSEARRISSLPINRTFVYIDISDFSTRPAGQQALIINALVGLVDDPRYWRASLFGLQNITSRIEARMCIGDGYIFVFKDPVDGLNFSAYLAYLIETNVAKREIHGRFALPVEFHYRMGVHCGDVYSFWDPGRSGWNYIGDGINGGNRVLSAMGKRTDDTVFISSQLRDELLKRNPRTLPVPGCDIVSALQNRGRHADKHGNPWRVYELNAMQVFDRWV